MRNTQNLQLSQSSQPKPKIVYKNLEEIMKKCSSVQRRKATSQYQNENKQIEYHRKLNTEAKQCQPLKQSKYLNKSNLKLSRTSSRHSLQSKQKINYLPSKQKVIKTIQKNNNIKRSVYNRADAVFTDLQDFLRQSKEHLLNQLQSNDPIYSQKQMDKLQLAVQTFKKSINFSKSTSLKKDKSEVKFQPQKTSQFNCFQDYIMNRQTTLTSTINGDAQTNIYVPTETDDQLMNCLAFKNKVTRNNNGRKIHITQQPRFSNTQKTVYELVLQQNKRKKGKI